MIKSITILLILLSLTLNASANEPVWKHNVGSAIESTPVVSNSIIYFGDNSGIFHAMSEGGTELWNVTLNGEIRGKASVSDNIYVSAGNSVYSINKNGSINWNYPLPYSNSPVTSPAYSNGLIFFGYIDKLYAVNTNGVIQWTQNIGSAIVTGAPTIHNNDIYICNGDDLYVFSSAGTLKWIYSTGTTYRIYSSPTIDSDGITYFGSSDGSTYAVYPNGTLKWKYTTGAPIEYSNVAISSDNSILYVGSLDGYLHAIYNNITDTPVTYTYTNNTDAYLSVASSTYLDLRFMKSINMDTTLNGTIKVTYNMRSDEQDPYVHAHARVYKNSSGIKTQIGNEYATSTYYTWETFNVTSEINITRGDTIEVWAWHDVSSNRTQWARIGNMTVTCTDIPIRANGTSYWKYWIGYNIQSSPLVDSDIIYFGGDDNKIHAVYANGTLAWQYTTGGSVRSSASTDNGIFIGSDDGNLYAFGAYSEVSMFRNVCMSGNNVVCSQAILNSYGENGTLKNIWAQLTIPEKRNIGIELYKYLNSNVFYTTYLNTVCIGSNCSDPKTAWCLGNSLIRLMRFITPEEGKTFSSCYYKNGHQEVVSYYYEKSYGLVAYPVDVVSVPNNFYHTIGALQIGDNITRFDNWLFFQYGDPNIVPGSWNMPLPVKVTIRHYFDGECLSYGDYGSPIAVWEILAPDVTTTAVPTSVPAETPVVTPTPIPTPTITPEPTPIPTPTYKSGGRSGGTAQAWENGNEYRKSHTINQTIGAGADYQVTMKVYPGNGSDTGNTVYLSGKGHYFPNDINFTTFDNTSLNYWYDGNNTFYIKIPSNLNSSNADIYLYYGLHSGNSSKVSPTSDSDKWIRYSSNPVLTVGSVGAWDEKWVQIHSIVNYSGTYYGYYVGSQASGAAHGQTGLATSSDGITWTKSGSNPVIAKGTAGSWDDDATGYPLVWKENSTWYALYSGGKSDLYRKFGLATSSDGVNWTKNGSNPVLTNGSIGEWDSQYLLPGTNMLKEDGTYYLYYMGGSNVSDSHTWHIGLATSTNLINWTKSSNNPIFNGSGNPNLYDDGILEPHVQKFGNTYYMWYQTSQFNGDRTRIALATSTDKINWTKSSNNPIFNDNTRNHASALWDDWYAESPIIIDMGDHWNMYYMGTKYLAAAIETGFATYQKTGNASATFLFYDDFNNLNNSKWNNTGLFDTDRGELYKYASNTNTQYNIISNTTFPNSIAVDTKVRAGADWANEWGWNFITAWDNGFATSGYLSGKYYTDIDNYWGLFTFPAGTSSKTNNSIIADTYYNTSLRITNTTQYFYVNDVLKGNLTTTPPQTSNPITLTTTRSGSNSDFSTYFDYVFVRKFVDPEPGHGMWGAEENIFKPTPEATPISTPVITSSGGGSSGSSGGSSSSGSSGGGGGGGSPSEPYKNVNKSYKVEKYIYKDTPTQYNFSKAWMLITGIDINSEQNIPEVEIKIEELKNTSTLTNATPLKGATYYNIWINTKRFKNATIKFNCSNVATLLKWNNITWQDMNIEKNNGSCQVITDTLSTTFAFSQISKPDDFKYRPVSPPTKNIVIGHNVNKKEVHSNPFENIINFFKSFLGGK